MGSLVQLRRRTQLARARAAPSNGPGIDRLVTALCAGQVGAVLCLDASRLARNGRDWHGIMSLSCVDWWKPASSTSTPFTTMPTK